MDGGLFSRDENRVLFTGELDNVPNVFTYDIATGKSTPVTKAKQPAYPVSFVPGDDQVIYRTRPEGQSVEHLFSHAAEGSETDLTPWSQVEAVFYTWAHDGRSFYFGSNKDDRRYLYLYRMKIDDKSFSTVLQTQDMRFTASSASGRHLVLWKYLSANKSEIYIYDFQTKSLDKVAPEEGEAVSVPQALDVRQEVLFYLAKQNSSGLAVAKYDLPKRVHSVAYAADQPIVFARQGSSGRYFVVGVRRGDRLISRLFDTTGGSWSEIPLRQPGLILDISPTGRLVLYTTGEETNAKALHLYNLETKEVRKILPS